MNFSQLDHDFVVGARMYLDTTGVSVCEVPVVARAVVAAVVAMINIIGDALLAIAAVVESIAAAVATLTENNLLQ